VRAKRRGVERRWRGEERWCWLFVPVVSACAGSRCTIHEGGRATLGQDAMGPRRAGRINGCRVAEHSSWNTSLFRHSSQVTGAQSSIHESPSIFPSAVVAQKCSSGKRTRSICAGTCYGEPREFRRVPVHTPPSEHQLRLQVSEDVEDAGPNLLRELGALVLPEDDLLDLS